MSSPSRSRTCPSTRAPLPRLLALCLSSATLLAVVAPLSAGPARAADAEGWTDIALVSEADPLANDVGAVELPGGTFRPFTAVVPRGTSKALSASSSGDRVVTRETVYLDDVWSRATTRLVVRDISGALVRVVAEVTGDSGTTSTSAALSPDGRRVAWKASVGGDAPPQPAVVRTMDVGGGAATTLVVSGILGVVDFLADDLLVVVTGDRTYATVDLGGTGSSTPITFLDGGPPVFWGDLSRDGTDLAFIRGESGFIAPVQRHGSVVTVGLPVLLAAAVPGDAETASPRGANFTHDDLDIVFTRGDTSGAFGSLARVPAAGGPVSPLPGRSSSGGIGVAVLAAREAITPAAPTGVGPASRAGARATVAYTLPVDPTASFVVATRTSPGLPVKTLRAVVPSPIVDTGVVSGRTYTYAIRQVDRSGNPGPATTTVLRQSAPAAAVRVSGQQLTAGQFLRSTNGVRLRVNPDGNLVALSPTGKVLFQTRTRGTRPALRVNPDGNVVLLSGSRVLWQTRTAGQGTAALVVQDDGNTVLYRDRDGRAVWSTRSGRTS